MRSKRTRELLQFAVSRVHDAHSADDVVQPVTQKIWELFKENGFSMAKTMLGPNYSAEYEKQAGPATEE